MKLHTEYQRIEIINGILRPTRSASHPEAGTDQPQPQGDRQDKGHFGHRNAEFLGDRHHDQQEDREIERVEGPAEPRGYIGQPDASESLPCWHAFDIPDEKGSGKLTHNVPARNLA